MGFVFRVPSSSVFPISNLTLPHDLSNTYGNGFSALYKEGTTSFLNSMSYLKFLTQQVVTSSYQHLFLNWFAQSQTLPSSQCGKSQAQSLKPPRGIYPDSKWSIAWMRNVKKILRLYKTTDEDIIVLPTSIYMYHYFGKGLYFI